MATFWNRSGQSPSVHSRIMLWRDVASPNRRSPAAWGGGRTTQSAFESLRICRFSSGWIWRSNLNLIPGYTRAEKTCAGATGTYFFSWQHALCVTQGSVKEVSGCNTIRPLGVAADSPAIKARYGRRKWLHGSQPDLSAFIHCDSLPPLFCSDCCFARACQWYMKKSIK